MVKLNELRDNNGSRRQSKDLGRGIGSGKGKTAGRGGKGQTARSGVAVKFWEGGQMPLFRRLPKRGFTNHTRVEYEVVNIGQLQHLLDKGLIQASDEITPEMLKLHGLYEGKKKLKLLADGVLSSSIKVVVDKASQKAVEIVQANGGSVTVGK
jgi:large subunit ribosomal protein L15